MARGARLVLIGVLLAPLPLLATVAWGAGAEPANGLPPELVSVRDGDLYVGERQVTRDGGDGDPDWSPDRRRIAFVRQDPGARSSSLYVIRRDGRGLLRLTRGEQAVALPAWSGDGRRIAFAASPLDGGSVEWTVAREGGPPRLVATGPAEQIAPSFSPSPTHTHWHLLGFQRYELRTLDGALIVRDRKSGFCLSDHYGLAARRVTAFAGKHFLGNCARSKPKALSVDQGTSIGFTDLYPAHFHGQNLELRGVPAGVYLLIHRANPEQRLEEIDYTNNAASIRIRLSWRDGKPRVATLRRCHASEVC